MFRIYMHALRFTRLQRKTKCVLQTTHQSRADRRVFQIPLHKHKNTQPCLFQPSHTETLCHRAPKTLPFTVVSTKNDRV